MIELARREERSQFQKVKVDGDDRKAVAGYSGRSGQIQEYQIESNGRGAVKITTEMQTATDEKIAEMLSGVISQQRVIRPTVKKPLAEPPMFREAPKKPLARKASSPAKAVATPAAEAATKIRIVGEEAKVVAEQPVLKTELLKPLEPTTEDGLIELGLRKRLKPGLEATNIQPQNRLHQNLVELINRLGSVTSKGYDEKSVLALCVAMMQLRTPLSEILSYKLDKEIRELAFSIMEEVTTAKELIKKIVGELGALISALALTSNNNLNKWISYMIEEVESIEVLTETTIAKILALINALALTDENLRVSELDASNKLTKEVLTTKKPELTFMQEMQQEFLQDQAARKKRNVVYHKVAQLAVDQGLPSEQTITQLLKRELEAVGLEYLPFGFSVDDDLMIYEILELTQGEIIFETLQVEHGPAGLATAKYNDIKIVTRVVGGQIERGLCVMQTDFNDFTRYQPTDTIIITYGGNKVAFSVRNEKPITLLNDWGEQIPAVMLREVSVDYAGEHASQVAGEAMMELVASHAQGYLDEENGIRRHLKQDVLLKN